MPNRLANSTSPYLKQHEHNPIDWFEWGEEAFAKAKAEDKPIFLSIGYSSCHWCHVMAHETFEDSAVGEFLNQHFVCIKLDREERPDVDEVYMTAVQLISGRGGWPMSIFMTPDKEPFFAGTYFPREDRGQYPGFVTLANNINKLWRTQRSEVLQSAKQIGLALEKALGRAMSSLTSTIQPDLFRDCFNAMKAEFDGQNGGFGTAPKFPSHTALNFAMDFAMVQHEAAPEALSMVFMTLERMALGGIHDQVGGGFHRYSTDEKWLLPHFEKMLYDNAQLVATYARASRLAHELQAPFADLFDQTTIGILEWLKREMLTDDGLFCSAIDADSEGEEGLFYLWSEEQVREVLGSRADEFMTAFGFEPGGNYLDEATRQKTGLNIPHLKENRREEFRNELEALRIARESRVRPMLDNKAIAAWNGMMIRGLVEADEVLLAERCLRTWMTQTEQHGSLPHQITDRVPSGHAFLDDYAHMVLASIEVAAATQNEQFVKFAAQLCATMLEEFYDDEKGGFFFTSPRHEKLFGRSKPALDQSMPAPNSVAIEACMALGLLEPAEKSLMALLGWAQKVPGATESLIHAALMFVLGAASQARPADEAAPAEPAAALFETPVKAPIGKVTARLAEREIPSQNGVAIGVIQIDIPEGAHLNSPNPPARWLVPTELHFEGIQPTIRYPDAPQDRYDGQIEIAFEMRVSRPTEFEVRVKFQACTETECLAPEEIVLDGVALP